MATAAVREASNGPEFLDKVREQCGLGIKLLSGAREAEVSAAGIVSAIPNASGLAADLGGASLELILLDSGRVAESISLPFGTVRRNSAEPLAQSRKAVADRLAALDWLRQARSQCLYLVGGAWRALAQMHMDETGYPLHVIHHYALDARAAGDFCAALAGWPRERLEAAKGLRADRLESLPFAAAVIDCLLQRTCAGQIVFSANGLREGCLYKALPRWSGKWIRFCRYAKPQRDAWDAAAPAAICWPNGSLRRSTAWPRASFVWLHATCPISAGPNTPITAPSRYFSAYCACRSQAPIIANG